MSEVLEVKEVYRFMESDSGRVPILKGISFTLHKATFTTIMGPSGSGKSTLLNILSGLDVPSVGEVEGLALGLLLLASGLECF